MITTKEAMVDMDTKEGMDIKVDMATREDMATTKVVMVTTKADMKMVVAGTTTGTEVVVAAAAEEEATGGMVVLDMNVVAEVQVALAAGVMHEEAADEWVAAVGGVTKTIRSS
uniref:Uncharacterized protein n=1 Tax=Arundo donax TaxID=35708 RepID=A0A0A9BMV6_ARUDO